MAFSMTFVSLPKHMAMVLMMTVIAPIEAIIATFSEAFLFFKGRYTSNSDKRLSNIVNAIATREAGIIGNPTLATKNQNI